MNNIIVAGQHVSNLLSPAVSVVVTSTLLPIAPTAADHEMHTQRSQVTHSVQRPLGSV
jgi:hypothetical protein